MAGLKWLNGLMTSGSINPDANNAYDLGGSNYWNNGYFSTAWHYFLNLWGSSSGFYATVLANNAATANQTLTLPAPTTDTLVSRTSTDTISNKTLTSPRLSGSILDNHGNALIADDSWDPAAVNYIGVENSPVANGYVQLNAKGTDTDLNLVLKPKGSGGVQFAAAARTSIPVTVSGSQTNIDLNFQPKGTGTAQVNTNPIGVKVAVPSTATSTGVVGQWAADSSFFYICTAANVWRRAAIASW